MLDINVRRAQLRLKQAELDEQRANNDAMHATATATIQRKLAKLELKEAVIEAYSNTALDDEGEIRVELEPDDEP